MLLVTFTHGNNKSLKEKETQAIRDRPSPHRNCLESSTQRNSIQQIKENEEKSE